MTQTTAPSGKAAATAAAKRLLEDRIALVHKLGDAIDSHRRSSDAVATATAAEDVAAQAARDTYAEAITGGWTAADLRSAGLVAPSAKRPRTGKRTSDAANNHEAEPQHTSPGDGAREYA